MRKLIVSMAVLTLSIGTAGADMARVLSVTQVVSPRYGSELASCGSPADNSARTQAASVVPAVIVGAIVGGAVGAAIAHAPATHLGLTALHNATAGGALVGAAAGAMAASHQKPAAAAESSVTWYDVSYEYRGRTYRETLSYHPGRYLMVSSSGEAQRLPYDNPPAPYEAIAPAPAPVSVDAEAAAPAEFIPPPPPARAIAAPPADSAKPGCEPTESAPTKAKKSAKKRKSATKPCN